MEIRAITCYFCVILGSDWQVMEQCNVMDVLYILYIYVYLIIFVLCHHSVIPK